MLPRKGRPLVFSPAKLSEVVSLRSGGIRWAEIARRLELNPETCRRAYWEHRKARRAVGNSPAGLSEAKEAA